LLDFPNLAGISTIALMIFMLILISTTKCPSNLMKNPPSFVARIMNKKKVTIDYCTPYSTPQRGMNIDPKV